MDSTVNREDLLRAGLTEIEVKRLCDLRKACDEREELLSKQERRRLEFVRWLVRTGKLTEQVAD